MLQCDLPPHTTSYSFEIVAEPAVSAGAYITKETDSDTGGDDNEYTTELYNMYEVFATRKKDLKPSKAPVSTQESPPSLPPAVSMPPAPLTSTGHTLQYRYQASAEDQALMKELLGWILKGKLDTIIPAHIFAVNPPFTKSLQNT